MKRGSPATTGVVPAVVTQSYDQLARVKVRFPWMSDQDESDWIPVAAPMAGDKRGAFFMPEEHDQVLVAFAYGDVDRGYVIGSLWGSADKPPADTRPKRQLVSKSGHAILLDDTDNKELISIIDKTGKNKLVFDAANNTVTLESGGDMTIHATGNLTIKSDKDISIKGTNVTVEASAKNAVKGNEIAVDGPSGVKVNNGALEVT